MEGAARNTLKKNNPYQWIQKEKYNDWTIMSGIAKRKGARWSAWAKKGPMTERQLLAEPGEVYAEFGDDRADAIRKLIETDLDRIDRGTTVDINQG